MTSGGMGARKGIRLGNRWGDDGIYRRKYGVSGLWWGKKVEVVGGRDRENAKGSERKTNIPEEQCGQ